MTIDIGRLIAAVAATIAAHAEELTALDQAIGDGDHGLNMKRGFEAVLADTAAIRRQAAARGAAGDRHQARDEGRRRIRPALRHAVHGARQGTARRSGSRRTCRAPSRRPVEAVKARGKSEVGQKTMLDVLGPVQRALAGRQVGRGDRGRRRCCGRGDRADEGDPRPRLLPRRALDRPCRSRRALQRADRRGGLRVWRAVA